MIFYIVYVGINELKCWWFESIGSNRVIYVLNTFHFRWKTTIFLKCCMTISRKMQHVRIAVCNVKVMNNRDTSELHRTSLPVRFAWGDILLGVGRGNKKAPS